MTAPPDHYDVLQRASRVLREHLPLFRQERRICREAHGQMLKALAAMDRELEQEEPFEAEDRPLAIVPLPVVVPLTKAPRPKGSVMHPMLQRLGRNSPKGMKGSDLMKGLVHTPKERQNALANGRKAGYLRHDKADGLYYLTEKGEQKVLEMGLLDEGPRRGEGETSPVLLASGS